MPSPEAPPFPIDAVFTWVDGSDPVWRAKRDALRLAMFGETPSGESTAEARFRDNDELRFALRSLETHAPWINTVHLLTDDQVPAWLDRERVNVVSHRDVFPPNVPLPVFSTRPIEFCLHRIPDLAERFLSFNDDFMLGRGVSWREFFLPDGRPKIWVVRRGRKTMAKLIATSQEENSHTAAVARGHRMIHARYGRLLPYTIRHFPKSMTRSSASLLWEVFPQEVKTTLHNPFRASTDVFVAALYPLFALAEGLGVARPVNGLCQVLDVLGGKGPAHMGASLGDDNFAAKTRAIRRWRPRTFCLNDAPGATEADQCALRDFLRDMFPHPSRFEVRHTCD